MCQMQSIANIFNIIYIICILILIYFMIYFIYFMKMEEIAVSLLIFKQLKHAKKMHWWKK